jgi:hypothetical protein
MKLKNEDGTDFIDALGRTEFDECLIYYDDRIITEVEDKRIITEKDGSLWKDAMGRTDFDFCTKCNEDGNIETKVGNITLIVEQE